MTRELKVVNINSREWRVFLDLNFEYFSRYWPSVILHKSQDEFKSSYGITLKSRIQEGNRGLFLFADGDLTVGFANVYLSNRKKITLYVAEYFVRPKYQRRGYGTYFYELIKQWGRRRSAAHIFVEVDKDKEAANLFWRAQNLALDSTNERNKYEGILEPINIYWIRHGAIEDVRQLGFIPPDSELKLSAAARTDAKELSKYLKPKFHGSKLYTSPLLRAVQTAEILASNSDKLQLEIIQELREFFPEELIGMSVEEINVRYGDNFEQRYRKRPLDIRLANSEDLHSAMQRITECVEKIAANSAAGSERIIVSHGLLHNILVAIARDDDPNSIYETKLGQLHHSNFEYDLAKREIYIRYLDRPITESFFMRNRPFIRNIHA